MTAEILSLHPIQGQACSRPSLPRSLRSLGGLCRIIRRIVEAVGWIIVLGLILGFIQ